MDKYWEVINIIKKQTKNTITGRKMQQMKDELLVDKEKNELKDWN